MTNQEIGKIGEDAAANLLIKKGYTILDVDDKQTLAAISPDGSEIVIVALNNSRDTVTITYNLPTSKRTITLKPWSVETFNAIPLYR